MWTRAGRENRSRGVRARVARWAMGARRGVRARARAALIHITLLGHTLLGLGFKTMLRYTFCYIEFIFAVAWFHDRILILRVVCA